MLGYGVAVPEWGSVYGPAEATDVFEITEVSCKGDEQNLLDCSLKSEPKTPSQPYRTEFLLSSPLRFLPIQIRSILCVFSTGEPQSMLA